MSNIAATEMEKQNIPATVEEDDNFVWQDYLEMTNAEEVPHVLFSHVEQSLKSSFQEGMMLEVPDKIIKNTYWPASIVMSCGPLLSLRYVSPEQGRAQDFWCDLGKVQVQPLGWCSKEMLKSECKVHLAPPSYLAEVHPDVDWQNLAKTACLGKISVPAELLAVEGYTAIDRIKQGMKVEVQDEKIPLHHWVATIIENVGGRLLLRYESPDQGIKDFWLFYNSKRLFPLGWAEEKGNPWRYRPPSSFKTAHSEEDRAAILEFAKLEASKIAPAPDLFQVSAEMISHEIQEGMKLEAVHTRNMVEVCPATVLRLFPTGHFLLQIDCLASFNPGEALVRLCTMGDPYIFPVGWCKNHNLQLTHPRGWTTTKEDFDWSEYLEDTGAIAVPTTFFPKIEPADDIGFVAGNKLEAVNPENPDQICAASILQTVGHLLWIHLEPNDSFHPSHICSTTSTDIFPVGWCGSNSYPLKPPRSFQTFARPTPGRDLKVMPVAPEVTQKSSWCPKLFFNHRCFSGPFLSKSKLAQLPKAVGPGPVTLVMREVLSMLISVAYKSRQVLKELQLEGKLPPSMHLEVLKAKLKRTVYRANVAIITSSDKVPDFCREVCKKLQSCPNLFGPQLFGESCPEGCNVLSKTRFTNYWSKHKRGPRPAENATGKPAKRGRKKGFSVTKSHTIRKPPTEKIISLEEDEQDSEPTSRPESTIDDGRRRKYKKKNFPQFEMRTRGAKLPNFALQMANWTWNKDTYIPKKRQRVSSDNASVGKTTPEKEEIQVKRKRGRPRLKKPTPVEKPVIKALDSNPMDWTVDDVSNYLHKTPDLGEVAKRLSDEAIDGHAFMLLNLPTLQENLKLKLGQAIKLCQHVEYIKYSFLTEYCNGISK